MLPDFFFCSLFPVQQTTSGIGPRVKEFFRVGNQYAKCEKQQTTTYIHTYIVISIIDPPSGGSMRVA